MHKNLKIIIDERKIEEYLLNEKHRDGGTKAKFFTSHGFSMKYPEVLRNTLIKHFEENNVIEK